MMQGANRANVSFYPVDPDRLFSGTHTLMSNQALEIPAQRPERVGADVVCARFAGIEREFERVDSDGDGRISPEEFWRLRRFQAQQKFKKQ